MHGNTHRARLSTKEIKAQYMCAFASLPLPFLLLKLLAPLPDLLPPLPAPDPSLQTGSPSGTFLSPLFLDFCFFSLVVFVLFFSFQERSRFVDHYDNRYEQSVELCSWHNAFNCLQCQQIITRMPQRLLFHRHMLTERLTRNAEVHFIKTHNRYFLVFYTFSTSHLQHGLRRRGKVSFVIVSSGNVI